MDVNHWAQNKKTRKNKGGHRGQLYNFFFPLLAPINVLGVAFDLEGTLVNLEPIHHGAHIEVARRIGLELTLEYCVANVPFFIGGPDERIYEALLAMAGATQVSVEEMLTWKRAIYQERIGSWDVKPRLGALMFIQVIQDLGVPTAIGSLTAQAEALVILERSGLNRCFRPDLTVLREDVTEPKPAPDVYILTAQLMGIRSENQLVFEDSPRGVQAAIAAGSRAIGMPVYEAPEVTAALLQAGATRAYKSWWEINPDKLIDDLLE